MSSEPLPAKAWHLRRTIGYSLLVIAVFFAVQAATLFCMLVALQAGGAGLDERVVDVGSDGLFLSLGTIATTLICVPFVKYLVGRREVAPWAFLRLRLTDTRALIVWSLGLAAFVLASDLLTTTLRRPIVPEFMTDVYASTHPALLFVAIVFAAPVFEEVFFRGFLTGALEASGVSVLAAGVATSVVWSAVHIQYDAYGVITVFFLGLLLAAARARTGSLLPCFVMHGLANAIAFVETAVITRQAVG